MPLTSLNAASNIPHSAIASQHSSRVTTTFNARCTGHWTVEDFNLKFANLDSKSVQYRTVLSAWYPVQERNVPDHGTATGTGVHFRVVWGYRELWIQEVVLLQKTMELHKPDTFLYDQSFRSQRSPRFSFDLLYCCRWKETSHCTQVNLPGNSGSMAAFSSSLSCGSSLWIASCCFLSIYDTGRYYTKHFQIHTTCMGIMHDRTHTHTYTNKHLSGMGVMQNKHPPWLDAIIHNGQEAPTLQLCSPVVQMRASVRHKHRGANTRSHCTFSYQRSSQGLSSIESLQNTSSQLIITTFVIFNWRTVPWQQRNQQKYSNQPVHNTLKTGRVWQNRNLPMTMYRLLVYDVYWSALYVESALGRINYTIRKKTITHEQPDTWKAKKTRRASTIYSACRCTT